MREATSVARSAVSAPPPTSVTYKVSIASAPRVVTIADLISILHLRTVSPIEKSSAGRSWLLTSMTVASVAASKKVSTTGAGTG